MRRGGWFLLLGCVLFFTNGVFAHAVQDSLFEKALDAESAGDVVQTIALLEQANSYQGKYNAEIREILDSYYEALQMKDSSTRDSAVSFASEDSAKNRLNFLSRVEFIGIKYDEYGDSLGANEYSGEAYLQIGAEYEIRRGTLSHFFMASFSTVQFMREDSTVFDTSRWAFTPSLEYTVQGDRFVASLDGDVNISERDGAVFGVNLAVEKDFYVLEDYRAGVSAFGYLNDRIRTHAKIGGYWEYRPQYGFWTNLSLSGRFERDTSVSAYFWHSTDTGFGGFWEYGADSSIPVLDSVQERYYLGRNVKIGPEVRMQMGFRFNKMFSLDFLGYFFWSYNPFEDEWMTFVDEVEGQAGWVNLTWNREILQGSARLRLNWHGEHFGTYFSVWTYFLRYLDLPSGHPEIYAYAYILGEIRLGATFRF